MKHSNLYHAVLTASVVAAAAGASVLFAPDAAAQSRSVPTFAVEAGWPKVPSQWKLGEISSIAIDAQSNAWVLHRPRTLKPEQAAMKAPPVLVFDPAGNYIKSWGGATTGEPALAAATAATGYEWPEREHGIHIDNKGFVWLGGNNCPTNGLPGLRAVFDDQLLKFTQDGKFVMQVGKSNQSKGNADTANLHRPADAWLHPATNELFVADGYGNHRVVVLDPDTGAFKRMWGAYGNKPVDDDHCQAVRMTDFSEPGPSQFSIAHSIKVSNDGIVYLADRENRRVQTFTTDGKFVKQLVRGAEPFAKNLAFSPDSEQTFLYVGGDKDIVIIERKSLQIVGSIAGPGVLGGGHHIATDAKGNVYVAATGQGMQRLTYKGMSTASR
jgi:DNA-binding beta-propeller fold protein YncE